MHIVLLWGTWGYELTENFWRNTLLFFYICWFFRSRTSCSKIIFIWQIFQAQGTVSSKITDRVPMHLFCALLWDVKLILQQQAVCPNWYMGRVAHTCLPSAKTSRGFQGIRREGRLASVQDHLQGCHVPHSKTFFLPSLSSLIFIFFSWI